MAIKTGQASAAKNIKAGCGIRYDPEQLGNETGFDFSDAEGLKACSEDVSELNENLKGQNKQEIRGADRDSSAETSDA